MRNARKGVFVGFATALMFVGLLALAACSPVIGDDAAQDGSAFGSEPISLNIDPNRPLLNLVCDGSSKGLDLTRLDPADFTGDFRIELELKAGPTQNTYANILDFNHRTNVGIVIQQMGTDTNNFLFGIGNGSTSVCLTAKLDTINNNVFVFQRSGAYLELYAGWVSPTAPVGSYPKTIGLACIAREVCFKEPIAFIPGSVPTLGYNKNYGRGFNGTIISAKFYKGVTGLYKNQAVCDGSPNGGVNLGSSFSSQLTGDFVIELNVLPKSTQNTYANILDVNHRANVGLVIQQAGDDVNNYVFGIGFGNTSACILQRLTPDKGNYICMSREGGVFALQVYPSGPNSYQSVACDPAAPISIIPGSNITMGYNANYGRYFNGTVYNLRVFTPLIAY